MRRHSDVEKRHTWRMSIWALLIGVITLIILVFIGFPSDLFIPVDTADWGRAVLTLLLIVCGCVALMGPQTALEDFEVRTHTGSGPVLNPISYLLNLLTGFGILFCIILVLAWVFGLLEIPIIERDT